MKPRRKCSLQPSIRLRCRCGRKKQQEEPGSFLRILQEDYTQLAEAQHAARGYKKPVALRHNEGAWAALNNNVGWARLYNPGGTTWNISQQTVILDFVPGTRRISRPFYLPILSDEGEGGHFTAPGNPGLPNLHSIGHRKFEWILFIRNCT